MKLNGCIAHSPHTASIPTHVNDELNGTLDQNETVRYNLQIPVNGVTVEVCADTGHIVVYGSSSVPNPNSAFYEFFLQVYGNGPEPCDHVFYEPTVSPISSSDHQMLRRETETSRLFLSVIGKAEENTFVHLKTTPGDIYPVNDTGGNVYPVSNNTSKSFICLGYHL